MKIYVASSWRNNSQPEVVALIRAAGYEVYDFKNPAHGNNGFHWSEIDPNWKQWTPEQFVDALGHPIAGTGFWSDMEALQECDACVLVLPCGRSAHLEAGWAIGAGKPTVLLLTGAIEPELMYGMAADICIDTDDLLNALSNIQANMPGRCRVCGCTDDKACLGGCHWVEHDLCSACVDDHGK